MTVPYIDSTTGELKVQGNTGTPGILCDSAGNVPFVPSKICYNGITGIQGTNLTTFTSIGSISFNPASLFSGNTKIIRSITFQSICQTSPSTTMEIRLYNLTTGLAITDSILSTSSNSPIILTSPVLTIPTDLLNSLCLYHIQIRLTFPSTPSNDDRALCHSANIIVDYV